MITTVDINCFPDIVWRLEGNVIECGIVLQYYLAKELKKHGVEYCLCGECADEIMNGKYYILSDSDDDYIKAKKELSFQSDPFIMTNLMVQKKNGIMLNSFNIEGRYPYKVDKFLSVARALADKNGVNKTYHKINCKKIISEDIIRNVKSKGGATDYIDIVSEEDFYYFNKYAKSNSLYRKITKDNLEIGNNYDTEGVEILMKYLYLILFERLFVSGVYDSLFLSDGIDYTIAELLQL